MAPGPVVLPKVLDATTAETAVARGPADGLNAAAAAHLRENRGYAMSPPEPREGYNVDELAPWEAPRLAGVPVGAGRSRARAPGRNGHAGANGLRALRRDPLLYPGRINALIGETESCKTWVAMAVIAQELNAGHHVIYADFEDGPESAVERLRALG